MVRLESPEPTQNGYMVTRYHDIAAVMKDTETFSSIGNPQTDGWAGYCQEARAIYRERGWPLEWVLVWVDPPEHKRFRKHMDKIFSPSRVAARADHIGICIDKILGRFQREGAFEIDAIADYARMLPAMVMTREFAADEDDFEYLMTTTDVFGPAIEFTQDYELTREGSQSRPPRPRRTFNDICIRKSRPCARDRTTRC